MKTEYFPFVKKGIGRADYSNMTEFSVEPIIRSYQNVYASWVTLTLPGDTAFDYDIAITRGTVVIVYDYYLAITQNTLLSLSVYAITELGVLWPVVRKADYGSIVVNLPRGYPFFETIRYHIHNHHSEAVYMYVGAVGIYTDEEHYLLT